VDVMAAINSKQGLSDLWLALFDVIMNDNMNEPYVSRRRRLPSTIPENVNAVVVPLMMWPTMLSSARLRVIKEELRNLGWEGLVVRDAHETKRRKRVGYKVLAAVE